MVWIDALGPLWGNLVMAVYLTTTIALGGFVVAKTGRSPVWALLMLVPTVNLVALFAFAFIPWPREHLSAAELRGDRPPR